MKAKAKVGRLNIYLKELGLTKEQKVSFRKEWKAYRGKIKETKGVAEKQKLKKDFRSKIAAKYGNAVNKKFNTINKRLRAEKKK